MIASVQGKVAHVGLDHAVILVGGIGVEVFAPHSTLQKLDNNYTYLLTRLIVREDALTLYGFSTEAERDLFDALIKVNGVGPKLAIAIIGSLSIDNLRNAILSDKADILTRVPGIGKKTAQKIILELKDKLKFGLEAIPLDDFDNINSDVMDALISLGYSIVEAQTAIQSLPKDAPQNVEERVRLALQYFSS